MRALKASNNNADRAAEYLLSGNIPDSNNEGTPSSGIPKELVEMASTPQFELIKEQLQGDPGRLPALM